MSCKKSDGHYGAEVKLTGVDKEQLKSFGSKNLEFYWNDANTEEYESMASTFCSAPNGKTCKEVEANSEVRFLSYNTYLLKGYCVGNLCLTYELF